MDCSLYPNAIQFCQVSTGVFSYGGNDASWDSPQGNGRTTGKGDIGINGFLIWGNGSEQGEDDMDASQGRTRERSILRNQEAILLRRGYRGQGGLDSFRFPRPIGLGNRGAR